MNSDFFSLQFFQKAGVYNVKEPEKLFNKITGLNIKGKGAEFAAQVQRYDKERSAELLAHQITMKEYAFDYYFEKSQQDRLEEEEEDPEEVVEERNDPFEYFYEKSLQDKADQSQQEVGSSEDEEDEEDIEEELRNADVEKMDKIKLG